MHTSKSFSTVWAIFFLLVALSLSPCREASGAGQEKIVFSKTIEGDFTSNQDIPINLAAGSPGHPELLTLKQIRFETAYGNAWKVMARVQWRAQETAYWRITIELMDRQGRTLRHPRDESAHLLTMKGIQSHAERYCADIDLGAMQFEQRFQTRQYRLCLECLEPPDEANNSRSMTLTARDENTQQPLDQAVLQVQSFGRSALSKRVRRLYGMGPEGRARFSFAHTGSMNLSLDAQAMASLSESPSVRMDVL